MQHRREDQLGEIIVYRPLSMSITVFVAILVVCASVSVIVFGKYTRKVEVSGLLVPRAGISSVRSPSIGIVEQISVAEGDVVEQGEVLFTIANDRVSLGNFDKGAAEYELLQQQRTELLLREEIIADRLTQLASETNYQIDVLQKELAAANKSMELQSGHLHLVNATLDRLAGLNEKGMLETDAVERARMDSLSSSLQLNQIEKEKISIERRISELHANQAEQRLSLSLMASDLRERITGLQRELDTNMALRRIVVRAPATGTATLVAVDTGDSLDVGQLLVSVVPERSTLQAELFVPASAVGFMEEGQEVRLKYDAYPYQKFGYGIGKIEEISRSVLDAPPLFHSELNNTDPGYIVVASLLESQIYAYGKPVTLKSGATFRATVPIHTSSFGEMLFEPISALTGGQQNGATQ